MERRVMELLEKARIVLCSDTMYADALQGTIETFFYEVGEEEGFTGLEAEVTRIGAEIAALHSEVAAIR